MTVNPTIIAYFLPILVIWAAYWGLKHRGEKRAIAVRDEAIAAGLVEPASLHPKIDPSKCIGCGSCAEACPEQNVLGLIGGKAELINPTKCIGHGACAAACPMSAISLVFGTQTRGVDIPHVGPDFQTNVPGIFIAGELGGMGLIRNAIEQGAQAMASIQKSLRQNGSASMHPTSMLDVVIIGAGPAGFSASLAAMAHKLKAVTLEQDSLGGTVSHYPRGKLVMTAPAELPIYGKVKLTETDKESLLDFWTKVEADTGVKINYQERVEEITPVDGGFTVKTTRGQHETRAVLLCIGRRGTPRKLDVPGEDLSKVVYRMIDPAQYAGQQVLVVGGGDSALEAACSISDEPGTCVTLSYRSDSFGRAKEKNRQRVDEAASTGRLNVLLKSNVARITPQSVEIEHEGSPKTFPNDTIIVCAGGILPTAFLKNAGISVETKYGTA